MRRVDVRAGRRRAPASGDSTPELLGWVGVVVAGLALTAVAVALDAPLGTDGAPFIGAYRWQVGPASLLAPAVAVAVLAAVRAGLPDRLPWRVLLLAAWLAAAAWALALALVDGTAGLAAPVSAPGEYLADVLAVGDDPAAFVRGFVASSTELTPATRQHPPGPVLLLWALTRAGLTDPAVLGLVLTLLGCLTAPLVAVAVRSLCGETSARRLLPVLVLAPYAVWVAVSLDGVTAALCAAGIACGVVGSETHRRGWWQAIWGAVGGLLLGAGALMSYAAGWLALTLVATYFLRRRPLLNVVTGAGALVPLGLAAAAGFSWPDGLTAAQVDFSERVGPERSWLLWAPLDLLVLAVACGPALARALRRTRLTPGWPFLVGSGLAVAFALGSGLSRGEVERSWLPFYPWLLVPAVAPARRPRPGSGETTSGPVPWLLVAVGAAAAVVLQAVLRTAW